MVGKGLTDELGDRIGLVIDGVDGHVHHVAVGEAMAVDEAKIGAIAEVDGVPSLRLADCNMAIVAHGGFGAEVREALDQRSDELVRQGHAWRTPEGEWRASANLNGTLQHKQVERAGRELAAERGLAFVPVEDGQTGRGKLLGSAQLASGRFTMIDGGFGFSLVLRRPVVESQIGREVISVMHGDGISWPFGRARTLGIGL